MDYRCYPQVRVDKEHDEVTCKKDIETVDGTSDLSQSADYRYDELFTYSGYETGVTVKADGTTTVKVYLKRQLRTMRFS